MDWPVGRKEDGAVGALAIRHQWNAGARYLFKLIEHELNHNDFVFIGLYSQAKSRFISCAELDVYITLTSYNRTQETHYNLHMQHARQNNYINLLRTAS